MAAETVTIEQGGMTYDLRDGDELEVMIRGTVSNGIGGQCFYLRDIAGGSVAVPFSSIDFETGFASINVYKPARQTFRACDIVRYNQRHYMRSPHNTWVDLGTGRVHDDNSSDIPAALAEHGTLVIRDGEAVS